MDRMDEQDEQKKVAPKEFFKNITISLHCTKRKNKQIDYIIVIYDN